NGHVVCHNQVVGFGDALKVQQDGARAVDFYGNEILSAYDNGITLGTSEGNTRAFRNRFTNTYATISFQPVFGGPVYAIRNVVVNVANEQLKFHALGTTPPQEPSGMLVLHNTFVSPGLALDLQTSATSHHFVVENNIFYGPSPPGPRVVDWTGPIDDGTFDRDGWFPDGTFDFNAAGTWTSFAAMRAAGTVEPNGILLVAPTFANGLEPPATYRTKMVPQDVTLASASTAVDRGVIIANVSDRFTGARPAGAGRRPGGRAARRRARARRPRCATRPRAATPPPPPPPLPAGRSPPEARPGAARRVRRPRRSRSARRGSRSRPAGRASLTR